MAKPHLDADTWRSTTDPAGSAIVVHRRTNIAIELLDNGWHLAYPGPSALDPELLEDLRRLVVPRGRPSEWVARLNTVVEDVAAIMAANHVSHVTAGQYLSSSKARQHYGSEAELRRAVWPFRWHWINEAARSA